MIRTLALLVAWTLASAAFAGNSSGTNLMGDGPIDAGDLRPKADPDQPLPSLPVAPAHGSSQLIR